MIANRREKVAAAYLRGDTQNTIAISLEVDQATVSRDLTALRKAWMQSALVDINEAKARELAKVDNLELTYWAAWERSLENAEVQTVEKQGVIHDKDGKVVGSRVKQTDRQEGQSGNPAFLKGVEWCINKRCELLGLDAPKKQDITTGGESLNTIGVRLIDYRVGIAETESGPGGDHTPSSQDEDPGDG